MALAIDERASDSSDLSTEFIIGIVFLSVGGFVCLIFLVYLIYARYCVEENFSDKPVKEIYNMSF